ncbi:CST complex subunit Ten1 [Trichoderma chlorosporum]
MSWGPVPSQLRLLSQLKEAPLGDKVRFLGCVISYDTATACLSLGHMYPPGTNEVVRVDLGLVLETIQSGATQVGQWVNVVGYITEGIESLVQVQALLLWPTGPLDIGRYEKSLQEQTSGA